MMLLDAAVQQIALQAGRRGFAVVQTAVARWIREYVQSRRWKEVKQSLRELGGVSPTAIRRTVERHLPGTASESEREEVARVLCNLVQRLHHLDSFGILRTGTLLAGDLVHSLMEGFEPVMKARRRVAPGQDWILDAYLGAGGFGEVWRARNQNYPLPRAYKFFTSPQATDWMKREAGSLCEVLTRLKDHPNIVEYNDASIGGEHPYLCFEYVEGGSLFDWIMESPLDRPALDENELIRGIVNGLAEAHRHEIAHRDLKPANILLTAGSDVVPKIADFGLADCRISQKDTVTTVSTHVALGGTPMYLPPESYDPFGDRCGLQDDVFALGVTWYQVLVGRLERPAYDFAEVLRNEGVDSHVVSMITRCLARPQARFKHAAELQELLDEVSAPDWDVPEGCFDVAGIVREYLAVRRLRS